MLLRNPLDNGSFTKLNAIWSLLNKKLVFEYKKKMILERNMSPHFKNHYDDIDKWFQIQPIMNPPHSQDPSQLGDVVYNRAATVVALCPHEVYYSNIPKSESTEGECHPEPHKHARSSRLGGFASVPIMAGSAFTPVGLGGVGLGSAPAKPANATTAQRFSATPSQPESNPINPTTPAIPIGLVNLSSSEASFVDLSCKFGNTSQCRKPLSGHK